MTAFEITVPVLALLVAAAGSLYFRQGAAKLDAQLARQRHRTPDRDHRAD